MAAVCIIWAVLFIKKAGIKYISYMLGTEHPEKYDLSRFKIVYASCLLLFAAYFLAAALTDMPGIYILFIPLVVMWILFYTWCRKR